MDKRETNKIDNYYMPPLEKIAPGADILLMEQFIKNMRREYVFAKIKGAVDHIPFDRIEKECAFFFCEKWEWVKPEWEKVYRDTVERKTYRGMKFISVGYLTKEEKKFIAEVKKLLPEHFERKDVLKAIKVLKERGIVFNYKKDELD